LKYFETIGDINFFGKLANQGVLNFNAVLAYGAPKKILLDIKTRKRVCGRLISLFWMMAKSDRHSGIWIGRFYWTTLANGSKIHYQSNSPNIILILF
jgi:hypothetical protein